MARYARGRDYHYAHRDRLKALRKRLLRLDPGVETYACVDTGVAMEKPWAERAGLGWIGKNGCLITRSHGSYLTLSVMFLDRAVDGYDAPHADLLRRLHAVPGRLPDRRLPVSPGVVDARRCLSYQTIENRAWSPCPCGRGCAGMCSAATSARTSAPTTGGNCPRATRARRPGRWPSCRRNGSPP